jgi:hypothetical protein
MSLRANSLTEVKTPLGDDIALDPGEPVFYPSITAVAISGLVTIFAARALIYAFPIFCLGSSTPARLRGSDPILVSF